MRLIVVAAVQRYLRPVDGPAAMDPRNRLLEASNPTVALGETPTWALKRSMNRFALMPIASVTAPIFAPSGLRWNVVRAKPTAG